MPPLIVLGAEILIEGGEAAAEAYEAYRVAQAVRAAGRIARAVQTAQSQLTDAPRTEACADCGDGPDCFEPPDRSDPKSLVEFRRQLRGQEASINDMSPQELMDNINIYKNGGGRDAYPSEASNRKMFRKKDGVMRTKMHYAGTVRIRTRRTWLSKTPTPPLRVNQLSTTRI